MAGLAAAQLMLARQEETEHPLVVDPDTHEVHSVTAAYATIMYRLGVVMTRLLAAAFWLGVGE
jgi:hypothetical protein